MDTQTIGKRIAQLRKESGLTQEQLAEKLGVTAQAVSKWENDAACPDISLLPLLADIFGVSVDFLLGKESSFSADEPKTVDQSETINSSKHMRMSILRVSSLSFALFVILFGLSLLYRYMQSINVSLWRLLWANALLCIGISSATRKISPFSIGVAALGGYWVLFLLGIVPGILKWGLLLPILLILWGIGLIIDIIRKPKVINYRKTYNKDGSYNKESSYNCSWNDGYINCDISFATRTFVAQPGKICGADIDTSFGSLTVDMRNCTDVDDNALINVDCNFGSVVLLVPKHFIVSCDEDSAFGKVTLRGRADADATAVLHMKCDVSFGSIEVRYC